MSKPTTENVFNISNFDSVPPALDANDTLNPFSQLNSHSNSRVKQVWAIGGGKGGVGKSLVSSSLAIGLAQLRHRVIAVDLDLGAANLHTTLGMDLPKQTLGDFVSGRTDNLSDCVAQGPINNLQVISGAQDSIGAANLSFQQKVKLLEKVRSLDADYVLLDLGAGTGNNIIDFFLASDVGMLVLLPEPTSIENVYRFIRTAYYRYLWLSPRLEPIRNLIELAMDSKNPMGIRTPSDLFRESNRLKPDIGPRLKEEIQRFNPKLILNQSRTQTDVDVGLSVKSVSKKYFGINLDVLGYLDYDSSIWQAIRRKRPAMLEFPNSRLVSSIDKIIQIILRQQTSSRPPIY